MISSTHALRPRLRAALFSILLAAVAALPAVASETVWEFQPQQSHVNWTLDTALHTVHGTFQLKSGVIRFDPATGKASGELIVDATSGQSGNSSRDHRMHESIILSQKYTQIAFRPDRVDGQVAPQGQSTVQVHGTFRLLDKDHELTMPVTVDMQPAQMTAHAKVTLPYVKWGVKNPSVFLLKVNEQVEIEIAALAHTGR